MKLFEKYIPGFFAFTLLALSSNPANSTTPIGDPDFEHQESILTVGQSGISLHELITNTTDEDELTRVLEETFGQSCKIHYAYWGKPLKEQWKIIVDKWNELDKYYVKPGALIVGTAATGVAFAVKFTNGSACINLEYSYDNNPRYYQARYPQGDYHELVNKCGPDAAQTEWGKLACIEHIRRAFDYCETAPSQCQDLCTNCRQPDSICTKADQCCSENCQHRNLWERLMFWPKRCVSPTESPPCFSPEDMCMEDSECCSNNCNDLYVCE